MRDLCQRWGAAVFDAAWLEAVGEAPPEELCAPTECFGPSQGFTPVWDEIPRWGIERFSKVFMSWLANIS